MVKTETKEERNDLELRNFGETTCKVRDRGRERTQKARESLSNEHYITKLKKRSRKSGKCTFGYH